MPTKQFKVQLSQTLSNPAVVTIQVNGNTVFNEPITSIAQFDLDVQDTSVSPVTVQPWSIAVSGSPITISGILNNYSSIGSTVPGATPPQPPDLVAGSDFLFEAGLIVTAPLYNGSPNTSLYDLSSYQSGGQVIGVGALPIPDNTICTFDLQVANWSQQGIFDPTISYGEGKVATYNQTYYVCILRTPVGTLPTNTAYWSPVALDD